MNATCPGCQSRLRVADSLAGKRAKCSKCGAMLEIPKAPPAEDASGTAPAPEPQREGGAPPEPPSPVPGGSAAASPSQAGHCGKSADSGPSFSGNPSTFEGDCPFVTAYWMKRSLPSGSATTGWPTRGVCKVGLAGVDGEVNAAVGVEAERSDAIPRRAVAVGHLVFANGVRANIQVDGPDADMATGVRVIGSEGFMEVGWDGQYGRAVVYKEPEWKPPVLEDKAEDHVLGVVRNAVDCLESGEEPVLSYRKTLRATEIIFAFYESVRRHARVELPLEGVTDNPFIAMLEAGEFARGHKNHE